ncbi:extracellular fatty acid-binding protein [Sarcophilus harrisii]|uniref:Lipocalin/cytosolic fatty-acid binding domain-containing protein n=1 Tax=Sarcophilus harrisii TaxID=9305 RepID=G3VIZ8_SARHA|nr:extracellular fatty acid-binding protein [Sarcophilus harrisii]
MGGGMWGIRMAVVLLSMGQVPICTFQVQNNITSMPELNISQAKGHWNFISLATNEKLSEEDKQDIKMSLTVFSPFANGSVNVQTTTVSSEGVCMEINTTYSKGNISEQYRSNDGSPCYFIVIDTDYKNYGIIYIGNIENKNDFQIKLYGRTKVVTEEVFKKFKKVAKSFGVPGKNLIMLSRSEPCS